MAIFIMFKKVKKKDFDDSAEKDPMIKWLEKSHESDEGHLSVDVYQKGNNIIVKSTIAGCRPENLDIVVTGDILTIKGERYLNDTVSYDEYLYRECYWGRFSRTIILPAQIDEKGVDAGLEDGVLTVCLPKLVKPKEIKIEIK